MLPLACKDVEIKGDGGARSLIQAGLVKHYGSGTCTFISIGPQWRAETGADAHGDEGGEKGADGLAVRPLCPCHLRCWEGGMPDGSS